MDNTTSGVPGPRLTEEERETAILRAQAAAASHEAKWISTGCFAAKGDADRARRLELLLIAGRRSTA